MHCGCVWARWWDGAAARCDAPAGMTSARLWLAGLLLLLVGACAPNPINCDLVVVAKMPLEVRNRLLVVPAGIDGKWVTLLVDSGAERTTLSSEIVAKLGLARDPRMVTRSTGLGGTVINN